VKQTTNQQSLDLTALGTAYADGSLRPIQTLETLYSRIAA